MQGFVYILTNEAMPGLVKIGRTTREVDVRAAELWQTGVPTRFNVWAQERTPDCVQLEAFVHGDLKNHRVSRVREFFRVDPDDALKRLRFWRDLQAEEFIQQNFYGLTLVSCGVASAVCGIDRLAKETGLSPFLIADALERVTADELRGAIERARADREIEHFGTLDRMGVPENERWSYCNDE
jgi:hypothetical protein